MTAPDLLRTLERADQRWATKHADDPAPGDYIRHLADAVNPLLQPGTTPVDLAELERLGGQLKELTADRDEARAERDTARHSLADHRRDAAEVQRLADEITQLRTELDGTRLELETVRLAEEGASRDLAEVKADVQRRVDHAVQAGHAERDDRDARIDELRIDLAQARRELADRVTEAGAAAEVTALLGRLVDAVSEEWHPDGDLTAQVDRAVQLVHAAVTEITKRIDAGVHVCSYPLDARTGQPRPCECGRRLPKAARESLAAATARAG